MQFSLSRIATAAAAILALATTAQADYTLHIKKPANWANIYLSPSCLIKDNNGKFLVNESEMLTTDKYDWVDVSKFSINSLTGKFCLYGLLNDGKTYTSTNAVTESSLDGANEIYIVDNEVFFNEKDLRKVTAYIELNWDKVYQDRGYIRTYLGAPIDGWIAAQFPIETTAIVDYDTLDTYTTKKIVDKIKLVYDEDGYPIEDEDGNYLRDTTYLMIVDKITEREDEDGIITYDTTYKFALDTIYDTEVARTTLISYYGTISLYNKEEGTSEWLDAGLKTKYVEYGGYTSDFGAKPGEPITEMYVFTGPTTGITERRALPPTTYTLYVLPPQNDQWYDKQIAMSGNGTFKEYRFKSNQNNCPWKTLSIYDEDMTTLSSLYIAGDTKTAVKINGSTTFNLKNLFTANRTTTLYLVADDPEGQYWYTKQPATSATCENDTYKRIYVQTNTSELYASRGCSIRNSFDEIEPNEDERLYSPYNESSTSTSSKFDLSTKNYLVNDTVSVCFYTYSTADEGYKIIADITESSFKGGPNVFVSISQSTYSTTVTDYVNSAMLKNVAVHFQVPRDWPKIYTTSMGQFISLPIKDGWTTPNLSTYSASIALTQYTTRCQDKTVENFELVKINDKDNNTYDTVYTTKTESHCTPILAASKSESFARFGEISMLNADSWYPVTSISYPNYLNTNSSTSLKLDTIISRVDVKDVYIMENPRQPGKTLVRYSNAGVYNFHVLPPQTEAWINDKPVLLTQNGDELPSILDLDRCGWYTIPAFEEDLTDAAIFRSERIKNVTFGIDGTAEAFNPKELFKTYKTNDIYIVASSYKGQYIFSTDPGYEGICSFPLMGILYDTDAKLHPAFSCYSLGGEGCQTGAQGIGPTAALEAVNSCMGITKGIVEETLGEDGKPILSETAGKTCFIDQKYFNQLFNVTEGVNERSCASIPLSKNTFNNWEFSSDDYLSPGAPVVGGYYPAEEITDEIFLRYNRGMEPVPQARIKRPAEGPVFMGPRLRDLDENENVMKINTLCNGPGWMLGMDCEGKFSNGDDLTMKDIASTLNITPSTYYDDCIWGWSCIDYAPAGWPIFDSYGKKQIGTVSSTTNYTGSGQIRWDGSRNQHFCFESHAKFTYHVGQRFGVRGDDDIWVFIGGKLAIDLGGTHMAAPGYVDLSLITDRNGDLLVEGKQYDLDFFFCDRRTTMSNMNVFSNIYLDQVSRRRDMDPCYIPREHVFDDDPQSERYEVATGTECAGNSCEISENGEIVPSTSSSVKPGTSSSVKPGTSSSVKPGTSSSVKPGTSSSSVTPSDAEGTSSSTKPKSSSSVKRSSSSKGGTGSLFDDEDDEADDEEIASSSSKKRSSSSRRVVDDDDEEEAIVAARTANISVVTRGRNIVISGGDAGTVYNLMDMQGRTLESFVAPRGSAVVPVKNAGTYLLKYGSTIKKVNVK